MNDGRLGQGRRGGNGKENRCGRSLAPLDLYVDQWFGLFRLTMLFRLEKIPPFAAKALDCPYSKETPPC